MAETQGYTRVTSKVADDTRDDQKISTEVLKKEMKITARVGQKAPDFTAPVSFKGRFTNVSLSDFAGK